MCYLCFGFVFVFVVGVACLFVCRFFVVLLVCSLCVLVCVGCFCFFSKMVIFSTPKGCPFVFECFVCVVCVFCVLFVFVFGCLMSGLCVCLCCVCVCWLFVLCWVWFVLCFALFVRFVCLFVCGILLRAFSLLLFVCFVCVCFSKVVMSLVEQDVRLFVLVSLCFL